jgi:hypothetical protein
MSDGTIKPKRQSLVVFCAIIIAIPYLRLSAGWCYWANPFN